MKIIWTGMAKADLMEIAAFMVSSGSKESSLSRIREIKTTILRLRDFPQMGRLVPELEIHNLLKYRELVCDPWRIIYYTTKEKIYILALLDSRRDLRDILLRRLLR